MRIREFALRNPSQLFAVSRKSSNARHRGIAVDAIGYGSPFSRSDRRAYPQRLDPDPTVRNNAIRALMVLASSQVELLAPIPYALFVDLLASGVREDRTKSVALLSELSEGRDPLVLEAILERGLVLWLNAHAGPGADTHTTLALSLAGSAARRSHRLGGSMEFGICRCRAGFDPTLEGSVTENLWRSCYSGAGSSGIQPGQRPDEWRRVPIVPLASF